MSLPYLGYGGLCMTECRILKAMPTVLRVGPYRFYFHSHEPNEPPHIHVDRDDKSAKFWLYKIELVRNFGFDGHEIGKINSLVKANRNKFMEAWHGYFGTGR